MTHTNLCWSEPAVLWVERLMVLSVALFVGCAAAAPSRCPYGVAVSSSFDQVHTCDDTGLIGTGLLSGEASQVGSRCGLFPSGVWRSISTADGPRILCLPAAVTATDDVALGSTVVALDMLSDDQMHQAWRRVCGAEGEVALNTPCSGAAHLPPYPNPSPRRDANGCVPTTCSELFDGLNLDCGIELDGCGGYVDCGQCALSETTTLNQDVWAAAVGMAGEIYAVVSPHGPATAQYLVELGTPTFANETFGEAWRIPLTHNVRDLIVSPAGEVYITYADSAQVDRLVRAAFPEYLTASFTLGDALTAPAIGPAELRAQQVVFVPGHPTLLAAYVELPAGEFDDGSGHMVMRDAQPVGVALYDVTTGARVLRDEGDAHAVIRALIPATLGVVYAGLDSPVSLVRYDIDVGYARAGPPQHENTFEDRSAVRWLGAVIIDGHYLIDAAGVLVDLQGSEADRILPHTSGAVVITQPGTHAYSLANLIVSHRTDTFELVGHVSRDDELYAASNLRVAYRAFVFPTHVNNAALVLEHTDHEPFAAGLSQPPWQLSYLASDLFWPPYAL